jgi:hypothetical protein
VSSKRSKSQSRQRGTGGGRVTPKSSSSSSARRVERSSGPTDERKATKAGSGTRADLNVKAVDRLVAQATKAIPKAKVRSAFSGTTGLSPNAVTIVGALPALVIVAISTAVHQPALLIVALAVMAASILLLMRVVNATRVVAELPTELVLLSSRRGQLEPMSRGPKQLELLPYRDRRWLKVQVEDQQLWVSRRAYGTIVDSLAVDASE